MAAPLSPLAKPAIPPLDTLASLLCAVLAALAVLAPILAVITVVPLTDPGASPSSTTLDTGTPAAAARDATTLAFWSADAVHVPVTVTLVGSKKPGVAVGDDDGADEKGVVYAFVAVAAATVPE